LRPEFPPPATVPVPIKADQEMPVVERAADLNERLAFAEARKLLLPYAGSSNAKARCALAVSCVHLADGALLAKPPQPAAAKEYAVEALTHATAATELDGGSFEAKIWFGQAIQTKAKAIEGGLGQARVCAAMVHAWDEAVELAPEQPLPYHLLGSFAFHTSALPWVAAQSMRALSPGLRKFSADDSMQLLRMSEERRVQQGQQGAPPKAFAVQNCSMLGRLYLKKGDKPSARTWLDRALELAANAQIVLDHSAHEAVADAKKARAKL